MSALEIVSRNLGLLERLRRTEAFERVEQGANERFKRIYMKEADPIDIGDQVLLKRECILALVDEYQAEIESACAEARDSLEDEARFVCEVMRPKPGASLEDRHQCDIDPARWLIIPEGDEPSSVVVFVRLALVARTIVGMDKALEQAGTSIVAIASQWGAVAAQQQ